MIKINDRPLFIMGALAVLLALAFPDCKGREGLMLIGFATLVLGLNVVGKKYTEGHFPAIWLHLIAFWVYIFYTFQDGTYLHPFRTPILILNAVSLVAMASEEGRKKTIRDNA